LDYAVVNCRTVTGNCTLQVEPNHRLACQITGNARNRDVFVIGDVAVTHTSFCWT